MLHYAMLCCFSQELRHRYSGSKSCTQLPVHSPHSRISPPSCMIRKWKEPTANQQPGNITQRFNTADSRACRFTLECLKQFIEYGVFRNAI